jgi:hypothetical protein
MSEKVIPIKPVLFSPGEVTISPEAFQSLRDVGLKPSDLIDRHTRGDWDGAPVKWMARNDETMAGGERWPIMSVYQLHPTETRVCVGTNVERSETSITVWPRPDGYRPPIPVKEAERVSDERLSQPASGRSAREIFKAWDKDHRVSRARPTKEGPPTRYGPDR